MKKILAISISILLLSFHTVKSKEIYVGIDYLNTKIDSGVTNISSNLDEKDSGYSLYAGLPINKNLDLEISYNDFGKASLSGVSGNQFILDGTTYQFITTASLSVSASSIGVAVKPKFEVSENISLYSRLGVHNWDTKFNITSTNTTANVDDDGSDVFYGFGVEVNFENLKGKVGYSVYNLDEDVDSINVGLTYNFSY